MDPGSTCTVSLKADTRVCVYFRIMLGHLVRTEVKLSKFINFLFICKLELL